jgi:hypothetical protein
VSLVFLGSCLILLNEIVGLATGEAEIDHEDSNTSCLFSTSIGSLHVGPTAMSNGGERTGHSIAFEASWS